MSCKIWIRTHSFMPIPTKPAIHPVQSYWFLLPEPHNSEIKHCVVPDHSLVNTLCVALCLPSPPSLSSTPLFISLFSLNFINIYTLTYCLCYTTQLSQCIMFCFKYVLQLYLMTNIWGKLSSIFWSSVANGKDQRYD